MGLSRVVLRDGRYCAYNAACPGMVASVAHSANLDDIVSLRGVDVVAFTEVYADMMNWLTEENQVSRFEFIIADTNAKLGLRTAIVGEFDAKFSVNYLNQARAVKASLRIFAAPDIRDT